MRRGLAGCAALALALTLAACNDETEGAPGGSAPSNQTLAAVIAGSPATDLAASALSATGLADVFDGPGSYTLLVPEDEAFERAGLDLAALKSEANRPLLVAVMRDHILPGYLLPDDIGRALDAEEDGTVEMATMGDRKLAFSRKGNAIVVAGEDGSTATLEAPAIQASNGVAIPLDGLLRKLEPIG